MIQRANTTTDASEPRVVIAHDYLTQRGGAERVVLALLEAFPNARLVTSMYAPESTFSEFQDCNVEVSWLQRSEKLKRDPRLGLPLLAPTFSSLKIADADLVVCSSSGWSHGIKTRAPKLVYCHTPARWLYEPEDYFAALSPRRRRWASTLLAPLRWWDRQAAQGAAAYLANSSLVSKRITRVYGRHAAVVHPPSGLATEGPRKPVAGLEPGYLLTISRSRAYKNTGVLVEAVQSLDSERLVVVGGDAHQDGDPRRGNMTRLGRVSDAELRWLYANCKALVAVSHEDFGLTPVEAYIFGRPAIVLRSGGYLDSASEGVATIFVDELSPAAIQAAIKSFNTMSFDSDMIRSHGEQFTAPAFRRRMQDAAAQALGLERWPGN